MDAGPVATRGGFQLEGALLNWAALLLLVIIWGSSFAALRIAVTTIDPVWIVAGRLVSALAIVSLVAPFMTKRGEREARESVPVQRMRARHVMAYGVIGVVFTALPFLFYGIAAETTPSAIMAICNGATPFVTVILARFLLSERMNAGQIAGVVLGFGGLALLVWPELQAEGLQFGAQQAETQTVATQTGRGGMLLGVLLAIVGAALYAGSNIGTRMAPPLPAFAASLIIIASGTAVAVPAALLIAPFPAVPSLASILSVLFLGALPTGLAMVLYVWLIRRAGPVFVSFTTYLSPLWATFVAVTFMSESLDWTMFGALALILLGVAVANPPFRRRSSAEAD